MTFLDSFSGFLCCLRALAYLFYCTDVSGPRLNAESAGGLAADVDLYIHTMTYSKQSHRELGLTIMSYYGS